MVQIVCKYIFFINTVWKKWQRNFQYFFQSFEMIRIFNHTYINSKLFEVFQISSIWQIISIINVDI